MHYCTFIAKFSRRPFITPKAFLFIHQNFWWHHLILFIPVNTHRFYFLAIHHCENRLSSPCSFFHTAHFVHHCNLKQASSIFFTLIHAFICSRIWLQQFPSHWSSQGSSLFNSVGPQYSCKADSTLSPVLPYFCVYYVWWSTLDMRAWCCLVMLAYNLKSSR